MVDPISVISFFGINLEINGDDILFLSNFLVDVVLMLCLKLWLFLCLLSIFLHLGSFLNILEYFLSSSLLHTILSFI